MLDVKRKLEEAESALADAEAEMWRRLDAIREARMKFQPDPVFPRLFVVIDEGMVLADSKEAQKLLRRIANNPVRLRLHTNQSGLIYRGFFACIFVRMVAFGFQQLNRYAGRV